MWNWCRTIQPRIRVLPPALLLVLAPALADTGGIDHSTGKPPHNLAETVEHVLASPLYQSADAGGLRELYRRLDWQPGWVGERRIDVGRLIGVLEQARRHGLNPAAYHLDELKQCLTASTPQHQDRFDVLLSDALLRYSRDVRAGRMNIRNLDRKWHYAPPAFDAVDFVSALTRDREPARALAELSPPHAGYRRLGEALLRLEARYQSGERWLQIPSGPLLAAGDNHLHVALLRKRLRAEAREFVPPPVADAEFFDELLAATLRYAQSRFGLEVDGVLGPATRRALNRTLPERIEQVRLNMDRWRWLPDDPGERYVLVNLAAFRLDLIEHGRSVMSQKVIVGLPYLSTPAFAAEMTWLVFNPYWEIPSNLGRRSVVPKQLENPAYFAEKGIRILSGWGPDAELIEPGEADLEAHQARRINYRLRQVPGPENALGRVKFKFPNRFNVYLHDTPERELFAEDVRTFSSGCIRLERPLDLATRILGWQGMDARAVASAFHGERTQTVMLQRPLPVYIGYWTAWVDDRGQLVFGDDIYRRDENILAGRHADGIAAAY